MDWRQKIISLPAGYSEVLFESKKYGVSRTGFNNGKSIKIFAEELGGKHFISFNYYLTSNADLLKPCEMPREDVIRFLENYISIDNKD